MEPWWWSQAGRWNLYIPNVRLRITLRETNCDRLLFEPCVSTFAISRLKERSLHNIHVSIAGYFTCVLLYKQIASGLLRHRRGSLRVEPTRVCLASWLAALSWPPHWNCQRCDEGCFRFFLLERCILNQYPAMVYHTQRGQYLISETNRFDYRGWWWRGKWHPRQSNNDKNEQRIPKHSAFKWQTRFFRSSQLVLVHSLMHLVWYHSCSTFLPLHLLRQYRQPRPLDLPRVTC